MDSDHVDALSRALYTRRGVVARTAGFGAATLAAALGLGHPHEASAKCKKKCGPCKRCKQGKCKPKPAGTVCAGGTCQGGSCVASSPPPAVACSCPVGKGCLTNGTCAATCDPAAQNCPTSCKCLALRPSAEGAVHCIPNTVFSCAQVPQSCSSTAGCPQGQACLVTQCGEGNTNQLRCVPVCAA
jgi:hypothetical protein